MIILKRFVYEHLEAQKNLCWDLDLLLRGDLDFSAGERSEGRKKALFRRDPRAENLIDASLIPCTSSIFSCLCSLWGKQAPSSKL